MRWYRIWALIIRYALVVKHVWARRLLIVYFPALDIIMFGLMGSWFKEFQPELQQKIVLWYLAARVFWNMVYGIHLELSGDLQIEIESFNIVNLFASPLKLSEWLTATTILGFVRALFSLFYGAALSWLLFSVNLFSLGWIIIPFSIILMGIGLALGIVITAFFIRWSMQVRMVRFTLPAAILLFSALFFPLDIFPKWLQYFSRLLPTTHIFQAVQIAVRYDIYDWYSIITAFFLMIVYLVGSLILFFYYFNCSKKTGLVQLEKL